MRAKVLRAYNDGISVEEIAEKLDLEPHEVVDLLGRSGIVPEGYDDA